MGHQSTLVSVLLQDFEADDGSDKDDNGSSSSTCTNIYCSFDFCVASITRLHTQIHIHLPSGWRGVTSGCGGTSKDGNHGHMF